MKNLLPISNPNRWKMAVFVAIVVFFLSAAVAKAQKNASKPPILEKLEARNKKNPDSVLKVLGNLHFHNPNHEARVKLIAGDCFYEKALYDSALATYKSVNISEINDNEAIAFLYYGIGSVYFEKADLAAARKYYHLAKSESEKTENLALKSIVLNELGRLSIALKRTDSALIYYTKSLNNLERTGDKTRIAVVMNNLSSTWYSLGNMEKALDWQLKSLAIKEKIGDTISLQNSLVNTGSLFIKMKKYAEAKNCLLRAFRIPVKAKNKKLNGFSALNLGICYKLTGQADSAIYFYQHALKVYTELGLKENVAKAYLNLGALYEAKKEFGRALDFMLKSLEIRETLKIAEDITLCNRNIANLYLLMGKPREAKKFILEAQKSLPEVQSPELKMEVYGTLSLYFEKTGSFAKSLEYFKMYKQANDSIYSVENQKTINDLYAKYETEKKEKQIVNLQNEQRIRQLEIARKENEILRQKIILGFTVLTTLLIFIVLYLIFKRYRNKQAVEQELLERQRASVEQRMLLMQTNPHFLFNALNSVNNYIGLNETAKAQDFLLKLSQLTRQILHNSRRQFIPLDEEVNSIKLYVELERERFANSFSYQMEVEVDEADFILIPPMLVQPFAENAIIHGLARKQQGGELLVSFREEGKLIKITVSDNGSGRLIADGITNQKSGTHSTHTSLGSSLVADRIALLRQEYDCDASIAYFDLKDAFGEPCGTKVELRLPYKERED